MRLPFRGAFSTTTTSSFGNPAARMCRAIASAAVTVLPTECVVLISTSSLSNARAWASHRAPGLAACASRGEVIVAPVRSAIAAARRWRARHVVMRVFMRFSHPGASGGDAADEAIHELEAVIECACLDLLVHPVRIGGGVEQPAD